MFEYYKQSCHLKPFVAEKTELYQFPICAGSIPAHRIMILQRLIGALLGNVSQVTNGITRLMTVPNSFNRIKRLGRIVRGWVKGKPGNR